MDRIKAILASWTLKPMNLPGRLVMVKSVLQAMPMYLFSVLSAPKSVLWEIRCIQKNFLWEGRETKAKFALDSWDKISMPKDKGGLGLRYPEVVGEVQGAKIWWRWCNYK